MKRKVLELDTSNKKLFEFDLIVLLSQIYSQSNKND